MHFEARPANVVTAPDEAVALRLWRMERIPAHSEIVVWAVAEDKLEDKTSWLVEPISQTRWASDVHAPSTLVSVSEGSVPVCIANWSGEDCFLPCGMEIGKVMSIMTVEECDAPQLQSEPCGLATGGWDEDTGKEQCDCPADQDPWSVLQVGDGDLPEYGLVANEWNSKQTRVHEAATSGLATQDERGGSSREETAVGQASADDLGKLRKIVREHRKVFAMSSKGTRPDQCDGTQN